MFPLNLIFPLNNSDIIPALKIGAYAAHIPFHTTWQHVQVAQPDLSHDRYVQLESIRDLPDLLAREFEGVRESGKQGIRNQGIGD